MTTEKKKDYVTPVAIGLGVAGLAAGIYFVTKKPAGVDPGEQIRAIVKFDYEGPTDTVPYIISIRFGRNVLGIFVPEVSLGTWQQDIELPGPGKYDFEIPIDVPPDAKAGKWRAELMIRYPEQELGHDWIFRAFRDDAINVRKEE